MSTTPIASRTETRLEVHRREFKLAKFTGPMIRIETLGQDEIALINNEFLERCRLISPENLDQIYSAYVRTLHSWGVICPHPQPHRLYDGFHSTHVPIPFEDSQWYTCRLCETTVINR